MAYLPKAEPAGSQATHHHREQFRLRHRRDVELDQRSFRLPHEDVGRPLMDSALEVPKRFKAPPMMRITHFMIPVIKNSDERRKKTMMGNTLKAKVKPMLSPTISPNKKEIPSLA